MSNFPITCNCPSSQIPSTDTRFVCLDSIADTTFTTVPVGHNLPASADFVADLGICRSTQVYHHVPGPHAPTQTAFSCKAAASAAPPHAKTAPPPKVSRAAALLCPHQVVCYDTHGIFSSPRLWCVCILLAKTCWDCFLAGQVSILMSKKCQACPLSFASCQPTIRISVRGHPAPTSAKLTCTPQVHASRLWPRGNCSA